MSDVLSIALTSRDGITLNTKGTYCDKNIQIIPQLENKTVTPTEAVQTITAGENYAGLKTVTVRAIPTEYVVPSGEVSITSNGTHDVSGKASAVVNVPVPDGYIKPSGSLDITKNETVDVTNYASAIVNVSIPDGYILPIGTQEITENGEYNITDKEKVNVNVPIPDGYIKPRDELTINDNNKVIDVTQYARVHISTAKPYNVVSASFMDNLLSSTITNIGDVYKYTGETTDTYENGALYILEEV